MKLTTAIIGLLLLVSGKTFALTSEIVFSWRTTPTGVDHIYLMNSDGTYLRQLTNTANSDRAPEWKPDGTQISFLRSGNTIFRINPDGTNLVQISPSRDISATTGDVSANWSPDGTKIIYAHVTVVGGNTQTSAIMTMSAVDGSNQQTILANDRTHIQDEPRFSPDGTLVVFGSNFAAPTSAESIWKCNTSSCDATKTQMTSILAAGSPRFSPDGSKIVMLCADPSAPYNSSQQLCTVPVGGGSPTILTSFLNSTQNPEEPSYSPDGNTIIFSLDNRGGKDPTAPAFIYTMNSNGTNQTNSNQHCSAAGGSPRFLQGPHNFLQLAF